MAGEIFSGILLLGILPTLLVAPSIVDLANHDSAKTNPFSKELKKLNDLALLDFRGMKQDSSSLSQVKSLTNNIIRKKRDLNYAKQLLDLLVIVETLLEKRYGVTEPQCQLRATCEIHRRNINGIQSSRTDRNFVKFVSEMRREIKNPRVVPMAKYVFEYYEKAAERGEQQRDCGHVYPRCPYSVDTYTKTTKSKTNYGSSRSWYK